MIRVADALHAMEHLPLVRFDQIGMRGLVVVAPHPDDESLGCAGLLASARAAAIETRVVFVSDGAASHPRSRIFPRDRLRALREREALTALARIGIQPDAARFLRLPDAAVPETGPAADAAIAALVDALDACHASHMAVTWRHDPHCDHRASFALAAAACRERPEVRLLAYPIWGFELPPQEVIDDGRPDGFRLDIAAHLPAKRAAIAAHASQVTRLIDDDPQGFVLSAEQLARFDRPFEIFLDVQP
ncbi:PIG-L family deacetylase [Ancylobacter sp. A5.8]|uniref:PIG-L deacetylase family protein n=1 Tax=Ancylobacter gelatini TaxID=2919920 RepID=UPI001F4EE05B|nr:PIG-L family deacetylase [Ancylobacter gelatini]MCJ8142240.1 PIG-L family deacetylase [Ancylobacter gelatini]